jgi:LysM repeat protein
MYPRRLSLIFTIFSLLFVIYFLPDGSTPEHALALVPASNAYDLIDAVNGLRASHGLPAYNPNSILMQIAQSQADYLASTGGASGHIGPGGTHPIDRAIAAGYPVSGGYISENWEAGAGLDAQGAVNNWMGDAPHQGTMLSSVLQDIGAGVAKGGDLYYYVIDCGLARGAIVPAATSGLVTSIPVSGTPGTLVTVEATIPIAIVNTPDDKGNVYHIVQPGQTLWQIALAYKTTIDKIKSANSLPSDAIFAGQKLFIFREGTSTPLPAAPTNTLNPASSTPLPTIEFFTQTPTGTSTLIPSVPVESSFGAGGAVAAIVLVALAAAGLVAWIGRSRSIE